MDAVASRVETAVTMRQMTGNMASVVKGMDKAMDSMNLERVCLPRHAVHLFVKPHPLVVQISLVMDKFEQQFSDLDVQTSYMEEAMSNTTAVSTPQDEIDTLMRQAAEEANIELQHDLASKDVASVPEIAPKETIGEEDDRLAARLRALRPAT